MGRATGPASTPCPDLGQKGLHCALQGRGGGSGKPLGTHHIVSFIKNHNRPLQVNAVGSATLQQEGKDARLGPKGSRPAGDAPSGHARLDLPTH